MVGHNAVHAPIQSVPFAFAAPIAHPPAFRSCLNHLLKPQRSILLWETRYAASFSVPARYLPICYWEWDEDDTIIISYCKIILFHLTYPFFILPIPQSPEIWVPLRRRICPKLASRTCCAVCMPEHLATTRGRQRP